MKSYKQLLQDLSEDAPANAMGGGGFGVSQAAQTGSPHIAGYDPILGMTRRKKKKVQEKFAGCPVFTVTSEEYGKSIHGRNRYERWSRKMNMEDNNNQSIRAYAHRNPGKAVIIKDSATGTMSYLILPVLKEKTN